MTKTERAYLAGFATAARLVERRKRSIASGDISQGAAWMDLVRRWRSWRDRAADTERSRYPEGVAAGLFVALQGDTSF